MFARLAAIALAMATAASPLAATTLFTDRSQFQAALHQSFTDTYEEAMGYAPLGPGGGSFLDDASMSAVVGETIYRSTGWPNLNIRSDPTGSTTYCAGCNGSFVLDFGSTSFTQGNGVFGVGLDVRVHLPAPLPFSALVTFGAGQTGLFLLPMVTVGQAAFFGLTDARGIATISFGPNGGITTDSTLEIDNLTIGNAVPEPASWAMMIMGFGLVGGMLRRRARVITATA